MSWDSKREYIKTPYKKELPRFKGPLAEAIRMQYSKGESGIDHKSMYVPEMQRLGYSINTISKIMQLDEATIEYFMSEKFGDDVSNGKCKLHDETGAMSEVIKQYSTFLMCAGVLSAYSRERDPDDLVRESITQILGQIYDIPLETIAIYASDYADIDVGKINSFLDDPDSISFEDKYYLGMAVMNLCNFIETFDKKFRIR
jgi:hypothetical protein